MEQYPAPLDTVFLALSDPTRRAVIARLGRGPASISELAAPFEMALPSFMKHIRMLEQSGWISTSKHGRVRTCAVEKRTAVLVEDWLDAQRSLWEARTDRLEQFVLAEQRNNEVKP